jgi:vanillate O-demethylase ferredoxin subunit
MSADDRADNARRERLGRSDPLEDRDFLVEISSTGARFRVPSGRGVAAVLARHGIDIPIGCGNGTCGLCLTRVVAGEPDHRDHYLTAAERAANASITPCCSRSRSAVLVLDL